MEISKAIKMLQGFGQKNDKYQESRIVQVNVPQPLPVDIEFTDITMKVQQGVTSRKTKTILKGVSGRFKSGELTAIMGPSGAGKSSLMNALTGFSTKGVTGEIRAGENIYKFSSNKNSLDELKVYRNKTCYILQDERLDPLFTVAELMKFAADLKLGNCLQETCKLSVINEILHTLRLTGTENTRCSCLSGGQRKRLSIAVELLDNPPVIFLDEPTTGLDSQTSAQCMALLKKLAREGRTIICTIHQPPASIYTMFDQVYILAEGMCIYKGSSEGTVPYLAAMGLQCPIYHNPADYVLEIASDEYGKFNEMLAERCARYDWQKEPPPVVISSEAMNCNRISIVVNTPSEFYKFGVLFNRCIKQQYRDWTVTHLKVLLHIFIGVIMGLLYKRAGNDASKTINNMGYLMVSIAYLCYTSMMPAVLRFPLELLVLKKENFNKWYELRTYYAAVLLTGMPMQIWYSFVYCAPAYYLSDQPMEMYRFAMCVLVLANVTLLADAIGNVIGTCVNPINGTFFGAITTCAMIVFAGFVVLFSHMNATMRFISHVSFLRYAFEALVLSLYSYGRQPLECSQLYCHMKYPTELLKLFSFKENNYWFDISVLCTEIVAVRIIAYFTLKRYVKR